MAEASRDLAALSSIDALDALHASYLEGRLQVVLGAGVSIPSGLPDWPRLNTRVLQGYYRISQPTGLPDDEEVAVLAEVLESRFGSSAAIDHVREELAAGRPPSAVLSFEELLSHALYEGRKDFEVSPILYELAAWLAGNLDGVYTFNYDDLLERAYRKLVGAPLTRVVRPETTRTKGRWVCHIHGALPPGPSPVVSGSLILSEKDYLQDQDGWADRRLKDVFECGRDVLLVGVGLTDSRLRRHLFDRARSGDDGCSGRVFALMSRTRDRGRPDLAHRKADAVVDSATASYWAQWKVIWLDAREHVRVPHLLRQIRLGRDVAKWMQAGRALLPRLGEAPACREEVRARLLRTTALLRHRFCIRDEERVRLTLWLPVPEDRCAVRLTFDSRWDPPRAIDPIGASPEDGDSWDLDVSRIDAARGAAGHAFIEGVEIEAAAGSPRMNQHFDEAMLMRWKLAQDFSSLLCVPVAEGREWLPLGVACLASNSRVPFWSTLDSTERVELNVVLRGTLEHAAEILK